MKEEQGLTALYAVRGPLNSPSTLTEMQNALKRSLPSCLMFALAAASCAVRDDFQSRFDAIQVGDNDALVVKELKAPNGKITSISTTPSGLAWKEKWTWTDSGTGEIYFLDIDRQTRKVVDKHHEPDPSLLPSHGSRRVIQALDSTLVEQRRQDAQGGGRPGPA